MLKLLTVLLYVPIFVVGAVLMLVGGFIENLTGLYRDRRLKLPARFMWYVFQIPPKTCQDCGDRLVECGHNTYYYCKSCNKEWANTWSGL